MTEGRPRQINSNINVFIGFYLLKVVLVGLVSYFNSNIGKNESRIDLNFPTIYNIIWIIGQLTFIVRGFVESKLFYIKAFIYIKLYTLAYVGVLLGLLIYYSKISDASFGVSIAYTVVSALEAVAVIYFYNKIKRSVDWSSYLLLSPCDEIRDAMKKRIELKVNTEIFVLFFVSELILFFHPSDFAGARILFYINSLFFKFAIIYLILNYLHREVVEARILCFLCGLIVFVLETYIIIGIAIGNGFSTGSKT